MTISVESLGGLVGFYRQCNLVIIMLPKKGQIRGEGKGKGKGKQPVKCRAVVIFPTRVSSSDEESWPVWAQLQAKIQVLEKTQGPSHSKKVTPDHT